MFHIIMNGCYIYEHQLKQIVQKIMQDILAKDLKLRLCVQKEIWVMK